MTKPIGITTQFKFQNEVVHSFECYPKEPEASLFQPSTECYGFSGKMDGKEMPALRNTGPHALLVASIIVSRVSIDPYF